jgi:DNA-binding beta-propeller fold protein YncE
VKTAPTALLLAALLLAAPDARAAAVAFKHEASIYADDREGPLLAPEGVACDDAGNLVVADTGNGRLLRYTWKDGVLAGGAATRAPQLARPTLAQLDPRGRVLALDRKGGRIVRVDAGGAATVVEPRGTKGGGPVVVASFRATGAEGLVLLDLAGRRVLALDADDKVVRELALPKGDGTYTDLAVDGTGRLLLLDPVAGTLLAAPPGATAFVPLATGLSAQASFPAWLAVDRGLVFLVDPNGGGLLLLGLDGAVVGRQLSMGRVDGTLYYPAQLCVTAGGAAFVADRGNNRVQVFSLVR